MDNEIKLLKNNNNRTDIDVEWVEKFYAFLQGVVPDGITIRRGHKPKLNKKQANTIIWYLQKHFPVIQDHLEVCYHCGSVFHVYKEGLYWETKNRHYCGGCTYLVPENYDRRTYV